MSDGYDGSCSGFNINNVPIHSEDGPHDDHWPHGAQDIGFNRELHGQDDRNYPNDTPSNHHMHMPHSHPMHEPTFPYPQNYPSHQHHHTPSHRHQCTPTTIINVWHGNTNSFTPDQHPPYSPYDANSHALFHYPSSNSHAPPYEDYYPRGQQPQPPRDSGSPMSREDEEEPLPAPLDESSSCASSSHFPSDALKENPKGVWKKGQNEEKETWFFESLNLIIASRDVVFLNSASNYKRHCHARDIVAPLLKILGRISKREVLTTEISHITDEMRVLVASLVTSHPYVPKDKSSVDVVQMMRECVKNITRPKMGNAKLFEDKVFFYLEELELQNEETSDKHRKWLRYGGVFDPSNLPNFTKTYKKEFKNPALIFSALLWTKESSSTKEKPKLVKDDIQVDKIYSELDEDVKTVFQCMWGLFGLSSSASPFIPVAELLNKRGQSPKVVVENFCKWCAAILKKPGVSYEAIFDDYRNLEKRDDNSRSDGDGPSGEPSDSMSHPPPPKRNKRNNPKGYDSNSPHQKQRRLGPESGRQRGGFVFDFGVAMVLMAVFYFHSFTALVLALLYIIGPSVPVLNGLFSSNSISPDSKDAVFVSSKIADNIGEGSSIAGNSSQADKQRAQHGKLVVAAKDSNMNVVENMSGVSLAFLKVFERYIMLHASEDIPNFDVDKLTTYKVVSRLLVGVQTSSGKEMDDGPPAWSIANLTKENRNSLIEFIRSPEGNALKKELVTLGQTRAERASDCWFGPATDYVCYAWGMPFAQMADALHTAAAHRNSAHMYLWVDIFALSQHPSSPAHDDLIKSNSVKPSPYGKDDVGTRQRVLHQELYKNIYCASRGIIVVADSWETPNVLKRSWCWFELAVALEADKELVLALDKKQRDALSKASEVYLSNREEADAVLSRLDQTMSELTVEASECTIAQDHNDILRFFSEDDRISKISTKVRSTFMRLLITPAEEKLASHSGAIDPSDFFRMLNKHLNIADWADSAVRLARCYRIAGSDEKGSHLLNEIISNVETELNQIDSEHKLNEQHHIDEMLAALSARISELDNSLWPIVQRYRDLKMQLGRLLDCQARMLGDMFDAKDIDEAAARNEKVCMIMQLVGDPRLYIAQYHRARTLVNYHFRIFMPHQNCPRDKEVDLDVAEKLLHASIATQESMNPPPPDLGATYVHLSKIFDIRNDDHKKVLDLFEKAITLQAETYGPNDPRCTMSEQCKAMSYCMRGKYARALEIWVHIFDRYHQFVLEKRMPPIRLLFVISLMMRSYECYEASDLNLQRQRRLIADLNDSERSASSSSGQNETADGDPLGHYGLMSAHGETKLFVTKGNGWRALCDCKLERSNLKMLASYLKKMMIRKVNATLLIEPDDEKATSIRHHLERTGLNIISVKSTEEATLEMKRLGFVSVLVGNSFNTADLLEIEKLVQEAEFTKLIMLSTYKDSSQLANDIRDYYDSHLASKSAAK